MEKLTKKQMKVKYVPVQSDEFEEIVEYRAFDGKIFKNAVDAQKYEDDINFQSIERIDHDIDPINDYWYRAKNQDEIELLRRRYSGHGSKVDESINRIKPGEWFTVHADYGGDYPDVYSFVPFKDFIIEVEALKQKLEN